jgi:hypothetical protein
MHADPNEIRLSTLLLELRDDGLATPTYRQFAQAACDGQFPATQRNGLWYANRRDKRAIAAAMGMTRATTARPARKAADLAAA